MKKKITIIFALALITAVVFAITACVDTSACQHRDANDNLLCDKCGVSFEDGEDLPDDPTCEHRDADDNSLCDECGESFEDGDETDPHTHEYTVQNTDSKYLSTAADCENAAAYYYSCSCGAKGTKTFSEGKANGHSYVDYVCTECGDTITMSEGLEFTLNSDGESYTVTGIGTCKDTDLVIPDTYNDKPVTAIGSSAFYDCDSLESIIIPNSVTNIGERAFYACNGITSVTIEVGITNIGSMAFDHCTSLTSITIPDSVTSIGDSAFNSCTSLTSITIPDSVTSIGDSAFNSCTSLTSVSVGNSVISIGNYAFASCAITSIIIPDSVTSIGDYAFIFRDVFKNA